jgi:site-specific DNA recombinase
MIAIYCRISTRQQEDKYSIGTQIERGMEFAKGKDFKIYQETQSGSSMEGRAEMERMLNDISLNLINKVWVIESSRLTRDLSDAIKIQKIFSSHNVKLYVNGVQTDFTQPEKLLSYHITSAVSEYERAQIVARSVRG